MTSVASQQQKPRRRTPLEVQRAVLFALLQRDLKARFEGRWLGAFWILLEPIAHVLVLLMIFGYFRHRVVPGAPFELFLITGLLPFLIFRNISLRVMGAIDSSRGLFGYRQVKPIDALIAKGALELLVYSVVYLICLIGLGWLGIGAFPDEPLQMLVVGAALVILAFSLGLLFAVITDDVPQLRVLIRIAYMPLYIISGVIFPPSAMPAAILEWFTWNPLLHLLEMHRSYFMSHYTALGQATLVYPASVATVALALALAAYRVRRRQLLAH